MKQKHVVMGLVIAGGLFLVSKLFIPPQHLISSVNTLKTPVVFVQATAEIDNEIPQKLYPCLPKQVKRLALAASSSIKQDTYYLVDVQQAPRPLSTTEAPSPTDEQTLVKLDNLGCLVVIPKEKMGAVSLTRYVPESVAQALSLQMYQKAIIEVGGKEKFQQLWDEDDDTEAGDKSYIFPENAWALQKLGIRISPNVQVVTDIEQVEFK